MPHPGLACMTPYDMLKGFCPRLPLNKMHSNLFSHAATLSPKQHAQNLRDRKQHIQRVTELSIREHSAKRWSSAACQNNQTQAARFLTT
jgi:hypothetical protein